MFIQQKAFSTLTADIIDPLLTMLPQLQKINITDTIDLGDMSIDFEIENLGIGSASINSSVPLVNIQNGKSTFQF